MPPHETRPQLFAHYEEALSSLIQVPRALERELGAAHADHKDALSAADTAAAAEEQRTRELSQTMATSYGEVVRSLGELDVRLPAHVRPAVGVEGDATTVSVAVEAQRQAERAIADEVRAASDAEHRRAAEDAGRLAGSHDAAAALRRRREHVRDARAQRDAEAERDRRAVAERARRRRTVTLAIALLVVVALALSLLIF